MWAAGKKPPAGRTEKAEDCLSSPSTSEHCVDPFVAIPFLTSPTYVLREKPLHIRP